MQEHGMFCVECLELACLDSDLERVLDPTSAVPTV